MCGITPEVSGHYGSWQFPGAGDQGPWRLSQGDGARPGSQRWSQHPHQKQGWPGDTRDNRGAAPALGFGTILGMGTGQGQDRMLSHWWDWPGGLPWPDRTGFWQSWRPMSYGVAETGTESPGRLKWGLEPWAEMGKKRGATCECPQSFDNKSIETSVCASHCNILFVIHMWTNSMESHNL